MTRHSFKCKHIYVGKDVRGKPGDRVILSEDGQIWCKKLYPDWYSNCIGTITRVDEDGKMCNVVWDDRDRPYHYHTGFFSLHHLVLIPESRFTSSPYLGRWKWKGGNDKGKLGNRKLNSSKKTLLLM
ncbi:hypothetical protein GUITHDRAFT_154057, partial [Guillardia theta CCMP2712]